MWGERTASGSGRARFGHVIAMAVAFVVLGSACAFAAVVLTRDTTSTCNDTVPGRPVEPACVTGVPNTAAVVGAGIVGGSAGAAAVHVVLSVRQRSRRHDDSMPAAP